MENNWISFWSTVRQKQLMHAPSMGVTGILAAKECLKPIKELCTVQKKKKASKTQKMFFFYISQNALLFHTHSCKKKSKFLFQH